MQLKGLERSTPPQLLVLASAASVQFGAAFANRLFAQAGPSGVVLLRLGFGALLMLVVLRPRVRGRSAKDWRAATGLGLLLATMNWSFYEAIDRMPLGPAVTIEFLGPLAVAVLGSRKLIDVIWVGLAGGGVALLGFGDVGNGRPLSGTGIVFALLAGMCWAGYIVMSQRVGAAFTGLDGLALAMTIGTVVLIPSGLISGGSALLRPGVLAAGLAVALLSSVIPYSLEITALRRLSKAAFGLLMSLDPALAALAGVIVLHQALHLRTTAALLMVVAASAGSTLTARARLARAAGEPLALRA